MKYIGVVLVVLLAAGAFACAKATTEGRKIDSAQVQSLLGPVQTKTQVVQTFGQPAQVQAIPGGERYVYKFKSVKPHWWTIDEIEEQTLEVTLRGNEVQNYKFRDSTAEPLRGEGR